MTECERGNVCPRLPCSSETALPAVSASPAQKHLSWRSTPRPAGGIGQEVAGLPYLKAFGL